MSRKYQTQKVLIEKTVLSLLIVIGLFFVTQPVNAAKLKNEIDSSSLSSTNKNSVELIISDMHGFHEGLLDNVRLTSNWRFRPRLNYGNDPKRGNFSRFQFWGIVYQEAGSKLPQNVRVEIRNPRAYYFSKKDQDWKLLQKAISVDGLHYPGDFIGKEIEADTRIDHDGIRSITMIKGYNYHFWPCCTEQQVKIDPNDIGGIFTNFQARLIPDQPTLPSDIRKTRFLAQSGGDYYLDKLTGKGNPIDNDDAGMGKFKFLTENWQTFNMCTMSDDAIRKNPPPLD